MELGASSWPTMISKEKNDKISIIVVNWNSERFLKECLGALSNQSYSNCETTYGSKVR